IAFLCSCTVGILLLMAYGSNAQQTSKPGKPDTGTDTTSAGMWALQPIRNPTLPKVKNASWVRNPIDTFVLANLEAKGMKPAPPAGKRELLRRVTFDLTGLPPSPEEIAAFLADNSPNAYEKQVDRLLASPRY